MSFGSCFVRCRHVVMSFAVTRRPGMENQNIGALGKFHPDGIIDSGVGVVLGEFGTQTTGLDTDHGVQLRIEVRLTPKYFSGDLVFLQWGAGMLEGVISKVAKQFTQGFRTVQGLAGN